MARTLMTLSVLIVFFAAIAVPVAMATEYEWEQLHDGSGPALPGRQGAAVIYDAFRDRAVVFGGCTGGAYLFGDTWAFDFATETWELLHDGTGTAPQPRRYSRGVYDSSRDRMIVFGGDRVWPSGNNDTWAFDLGENTWELLHDGSGTAPIERRGFAIGYDAADEAVIVFGGRTSSTASINDTWCLDLQTLTWELLHDGTGVAPVARGDLQAAFDDSRGWLIVFGGRAEKYDPAYYYNDTWAFDVSAAEWLLLDDGSGVAPSTRALFAAAWQPSRDALTLFGGWHYEFDGGHTLNEAWMFDVASASWTMVHDGTGVAPSRRFGTHGLVDGSGCFVVIAGRERDPEADVNDVWALEATLDAALDIKPGSCPNPLNVKSNGVLPVAVLGLENFDVTTIDPESVLLEGVAPLRWNYEDVGTPDPLDADPCDCNEDGPDGYVDMTLKFRTREIVDALGDVVNGEMRPLTITGLAVDGEEFEGTDCVRIIKKGSKLGAKGVPPATLDKADGEEIASLRLYGASPNPFAGETRISYALPSPAHVSIVIHDVSGRRVRTLVDEDDASGEHVVTWDGSDDSGSPVGTGVYFCRLVAAGEVASSKMIVMR